MISLGKQGDLKVAQAQAKFDRCTQTLELSPNSLTFVSAQFLWLLVKMQYANHDSNENGKMFDINFSLPSCQERVAIWVSFRWLSLQACNNRGHLSNYVSVFTVALIASSPPGIPAYLSAPIELIILHTIALKQEGI